jgi:tRNA A-37 threonylcarbamoyl transferase component Bud32
VRLVVSEPLERAALELGLLEAGTVERLLARETGGAGRRRNALIELPNHSARLHLRPFHHGGWLRRYTGDRLTSLRRPIAELVVNAQLADAGAPVPHPALVVGRRRGPGLWNAAIGTLHEADCRDGREFLEAGPEHDRVAAVAHAAGAALRRMHAAGGCHADLHLGNLLVRESGGAPEVILVDLDRARCVRSVPPQRRAAEMMRLVRSVLKRGHRDALTREIVDRFVDGYCAGDVALRSQLAAALPRERLRVAIHRLGYRHS